MRASCLRETKFHYSALTTDEERTDYEENCAAETDYTRAIAEKDCETVCAILD